MDLREAIEKYKQSKIPSLSIICEKAGQYSKTCLLIVVIFVVLLALALQYIPYLQVAHFGITDPKDLANAENSYRATLAQILGGVAVGIGIYFAWGNLVTAREGQITERFTRAVDQLGAIDQSGNPAIEIRLGGIYALERIANESDKDYWPIMEILTAYVRKNSSIEVGDNNKVTHISMDIQANESTKCEVSNVRTVSLDIQAILAVLGKQKNHFKNEESNCINLHGTRLEGAYLRKAHFEDADLAYVHLEMANLIDAHLDRANLMEAHLELARLDRSKLQEAVLLGAYFSGACLDGANLKKAYLHGAYLDADFVEAHLEGAYLYMAHLEDADLSGAYLMEANLENAILIRANMEGSDLSGANLTKANLEEAILIGAKNLTVDQLSKAETLYEAELDPELEEELRANNYSYLLDEPKLDPELGKELREKFPALFEEPKDKP